MYYHILRNLNFLDRFSKNSQISNLTKIRPVGDGLFHADGQTDMTKLIVAFPIFANVHNDRFPGRYFNSGPPLRGVA
jgi:hypothetical protein